MFKFQTGAEKFERCWWALLPNTLFECAKHSNPLCLFRRFLFSFHWNLLFQLVSGWDCYSNCIAVADALLQYNRRQKHSTRVGFYCARLLLCWQSNGWHDINSFYALVFITGCQQDVAVWYCRVLTELLSNHVSFLSREAGKKKNIWTVPHWRI